MQMKLLRGDCLELMKDIADGSIDMVLADLPYGTTRNKWDSQIPLQKLWAQYSRVTKENGAIVLFSQMPFTATLISSNMKDFRYEWIWKKSIGTGFLNSKKMPLKSHENILVFYKRLPTYNPQMRKGFKPYKIKSGKASSNYGEQVQVETISNGERYPIDVLEFNVINMMSNEKYGHPTQKPVSLLEYLIKTYTNIGDTVLDNCMGSGSTGVACLHTGREFVGMEKDENYFTMSCERIAKEHNNLGIEIDGEYYTAEQMLAYTD